MYLFLICTSEMPHFFMVPGWDTKFTNQAIYADLYCYMHITYQEMRPVNHAGRMK